MKFIQTFESYLEGCKQPLYHVTRNLLGILNSDMLKCSRTADDENAICVTRSLTYLTNFVKLKIPRLPISW